VQGVLTATEIIQLVAGPGGTALFAFIVWRELHALRVDVSRLASRIDYAAGADAAMRDLTPSRGVVIRRATSGEYPKTKGPQ
jgi:hypothetical protein